MKNLKLLLALILIFFTYILNATDLKKIRLQLQWKHQFEFAGFYVAKEKGFYKEIGLDLEFLEYKVNDDIVSKVLDKKAELGVTYSSLIAEFMNEKPIVFIANYLKQSPLVLITQKDIKTLSELKNKRVMGVSNNIDTIILKLMLEKFGVSLSELNYEETSFDIKKFVAKEIDAMAVFTTNEIYQLDKLGIEYNVFNPSLYGYENYDVNLFSSKEFVENNSKLVEQIKKASNKGWKYALENKEEVIDLILEKYNTQNKTKEELLFEAKQIEHLMLTKTLPIGQIDKGRVELIAKNFIETGFSSNIKTYDFNKFIFQSNNISLTDEERNFLNKNPLVKVYMDYAYPPYSFIEDGEIKGFSVEYAELLSKLLGVKFEYIKTMAWNDALTNLKNKNIDMIGQMVNSKKRREFTRFTQDYYDYFTGIIVRKENIHLNSLASLKNKKVGLVKGYYEEAILREHYPEIEIKTYKDNHELLKALSNNEFDASIGIYQVIEYTINKLNLKKELVSIPIQMEPELGITREAFGIRKDWPLFQSALIKAITLTKNQREQIEKKWLSRDNQNRKRIEFTKEESEYLKNKEFISMCVDPNWYPFEKIEEGNHVGISSEFIKIMEKQIKVPFHLIETKSWSESLSFVKNGKCEFLPLVMKTSKRKEYLEFTKPYLEIPLVIATKNDIPFIHSLGNLSGKKIGMVKDHAYNEIIRMKYPNLKIIDVKNTEEGLEKIERGELFGFVDALASISYQFQKSFEKDLKISGRFDEKWELSIAVKDDDKILLEVFKKLIETITSDQKQEILNKYISIKYENAVDYSLVYKIVALFVFIVFFILFWTMKLRKDKSKIESLYQELTHKELKLEEANEKLKILSSTDKLTNVYNRRKIDELLEKELKRSDRTQETFSLIMIDIDYFKKVNDSYGHQVGDEVLKSVSKNIKQNIRKIDLLGRWGGEEFLIICPSTNASGAMVLSENIRKKIEDYSFEKVGKVTVSIGVTGYVKGDDRNSVLKRVDDRLYKAKDEGRNIVIQF